MSYRDTEDGRTGQPFRPGGNFGDWVIGDAQRKYNQHMIEQNAASSSSAPGLFDPTPPPFTPPPFTPPPAAGYEISVPSSDPVAPPDVAGCVTALGMLVAGPVLWPLLYPAAVLVALGSAAGVGLLLYRFVPLDGSSGFLLLAYLAPPIVLLATLARASRLDHKLGRSLLYRVPRHLLRLGLIAVAAWLAAGRGRAFYRPGISVTELIQLNAGNPIRIGVAAVAVVGFHVLLWHAPWIRERWHAALQGLGLRSAS